MQLDIGDVDIFDQRQTESGNGQLYIQLLTLYEAIRFHCICPKGSGVPRLTLSHKPSVGHTEPIFLVAIMDLINDNKTIEQYEH